MRNAKGQFVKGSKMSFSIERNKKLSEKLKGHPVSKETREKLRLANLGKKNKPASEERKRKISEKLKGNKNSAGIKRTQEHKNAISKSMMGNKSWQSVHGSNGRFFNTLPEQLIEKELKENGIFYEKQSYICGFSVDFYLPEYRIIIECDGDYWHNLPEFIEKDLKKNSIWSFNGFKIYRFWEHEIKKSAKECINRIFLS